MGKKVSGVVEFIGQRGKAWNIKLANGSWYGLGFKAPTFSKNDFISFEVSETLVGGKTYENVLMDTVVIDAAKAAVVVAPPLSATAELGKPNSGKEIAAPTSGGAGYWDAKDARITFLACRNTAVEIVKLAFDKDMLTIPTKKADRMEVLLAAVDQVANDLYSGAMSGVYGKQSLGTNTKDAAAQVSTQAATPSDEIEE